jgi:hypothetical protein
MGQQQLLLLFIAGYRPKERHHIGNPLERSTQQGGHTCPAHHKYNCIKADVARESRIQDYATRRAPGHLSPPPMEGLIFRV